MRLHLFTHVNKCCTQAIHYWHRVSAGVMTPRQFGGGISTDVLLWWVVVVLVAAECTQNRIVDWYFRSVRDRCPRLPCAFARALLVFSKQTSQRSVGSVEVNMLLMMMMMVVWWWWWRLESGHIIGGASARSVRLTGGACVFGLAVIGRPLRTLRRRCRVSREHFVGLCVWWLVAATSICAYRHIMYVRISVWSHHDHDRGTLVNI